MRIVGLMSGTSLDGVDAALIDTDGERILSYGRRLTLPYPVSLRADLRSLIDQVQDQTPPPFNLPAIEHALTLAHAEAVRLLSESAELIGFHGQTILHDPANRRTWQIGNAALLARLTGIPVACDFRLADVAAGGQGAPLAPIFHAALAARLPRPLLVVNIGGVANLTWIGPDDALLACDTGPGNALLDDFVVRRTGQAMDRDGALALAGTPDETVLARLLADAFFAMPAPKSLDRQHFAHALAHVANLSNHDGAATLAAFTARAIAACPLPAQPARVLVTGGGRHNPAIMAALAAALPAPIAPVEAVGWDGDALEAQCFGFLAARVAGRLPLSFPGTTGVAYPMPGGRIVSDAPPALPSPSLWRRGSG
jgi:anhydro-N-acetylmuramic acid kinase